MSADDAPLEPLQIDATRKMSFDFSSNSAQMEADVLEALCEGFVRANQMMIRAQPGAYPCCFGCGTYRYEPPRNCVTVNRRNTVIDAQCQHVHGAAQLQADGAETCIGLACMMAALLREKGGDRGARVIIDFLLDKQGVSIPGQYHAMVMKTGGEIVDPTVPQHDDDDQPAIGVGACGCEMQR
jgi:hypothetical protein